MTNKIQINVTVYCAAPGCNESSRGTMDLEVGFYDSPGEFSIERVPDTVRVLSNLRVFKQGWGAVSDRRHPTHAQPGDWLCEKCL